ncbi:MAG TPA: hypothetical protein PKD90_00570, partial [Phnomibacter sp.]|nr:hypothetical protein [Phnomibacter sp.]
LKFVKASSYDVPRGGIMQFTLEFTDAEGDLTDSLYIERVVPQCNASTNRNLRYAIPAFPATKDAKGEIEVAFANGVFVPGYVALSSPACGRPDTTTFRFYIKDKEKNVSDTVEVDRPIIIRN